MSPFGCAKENEVSKRVLSGFLYVAVVAYVPVSVEEGTGRNSQSRSLFDEVNERISRVVDAPSCQLLSVDIQVKKW